MEPDPDLVAMLERLLAQAKAGKVTAIVYVTMADDGERAMSWGGMGSTAEFSSAAHDLALALGLASLAEYGT